MAISSNGKRICVPRLSLSLRTGGSTLAGSAQVLLSLRKELYVRIISSSDVKALVCCRSGVRLGGV